jgi:hypothetical protein
MPISRRYAPSSALAVPSATSGESFIKPLWKATADDGLIHFIFPAGPGQGTGREALAAGRRFVMMIVIMRRRFTRASSPKPDQSGLLASQTELLVSLLRPEANNHFRRFSCRWRICVPRDASAT